MWRLRRVIALVPYVLFIAFAFESLLPGAPAMARSELKVIGGAGNRIIPPRGKRDLRQPAELPTVIPEPTAIAFATPPPASPVNAPATPVSTSQPRGSLAGLRRQGITPAILLAGDLLLLIVALIIVIIDRRKRPR